MVCILNEFGHQWCFQLERGTNNDKQHYQVRVIMMTHQMKATLLHIFSCRGIDERDLTFLPESNKSIEQGGLSFYVMKDETRQDGPWMDASYVRPVKHVYEGKDLKCMDTPRPFQQKLMDICLAEPNDRDMIWVCNRSGNAGKSKLMKYMRFHRDRYNMARVPMGSANQIKTAVIEKGPHKIYMVDMPRVRGSDERLTEIFSALEEIKNGWVESAMYGKPAELIMEPPHIVIFSNDVPNLSYASLDRWVVYLLYDDDYGQQFIRLSVAQVQDMQLPKNSD